MSGISHGKKRRGGRTSWLRHRLEAEGFMGDLLRRVTALAGEDLARKLTALREKNDA